MGYPREEQETSLVFDNSTGLWTVYSTVPKHIRKLNEICDLTSLEYEDGRVIAARGKLTEKQVSMKKERVMSEEQRAKASERLSKARNSLNNKEN